MLERFSEVGRSEMEGVAHRWNPWFIGLLAVVAGAAGNQATHGVGDDDDLLDGLRARPRPLR